MKELLHHNCDPNVANQDELTPLSICLEEGFKDPCQILLEGGADTSIGPLKNQIVVDLEKKGRFDLIEMILIHRSALEAQQKEEEERRKRLQVY